MKLFFLSITVIMYFTVAFSQTETTTGYAKYGSSIWSKIELNKYNQAKEVANDYLHNQIEQGDADSTLILEEVEWLGGSLSIQIIYDTLNDKIIPQPVYKYFQNNNFMFAFIIYSNAFSDEHSDYNMYAYNTETEEVFQINLTMDEDVLIIDALYNVKKILFTTLASNQAQVPDFINPQNFSKKDDQSLNTNELLETSESIYNSFRYNNYKTFQKFISPSLFNSIPEWKWKATFESITDFVNKHDRIRREDFQVGLSMDCIKGELVLLNQVFIPFDGDPENGKPGTSIKITFSYLTGTKHLEGIHLNKANSIEEVTPID